MTVETFPPESVSSISKKPAREFADPKALKRFSVPKLSVPVLPFVMFDQDSEYAQGVSKSRMIHSSFVVPSPVTSRLTETEESGVKAEESEVGKV